MELPTCVLMDPAVAECDAIQVQTDGQSIHLTMHSTQTASACPMCAQPSARVHSRYRRTLADLPWANVPVQISIEVRRFFCDNAACSRQIFSERIPSIAANWSRRTCRLSDAQREIGLLAGGAGGARLCGKLACPAGVDLLVQLVRSQPGPNAVTPRVLGVDDWAIRKGQTYGTILIDHERGCVIDLLPDRTPETVAAWLKAHPGVEIVTRDRAEGYAQAIRDGAPDAVQVADRWHLLKNLTEALTKVLQDHHCEIRALPLTAENAGESAENQGLTAAAGLISPAQVLMEATVADHQRQARAQQTLALHQAGWSNHDIAQQLGCHPKTISRYLQRRLPLAPRGSTRGTKLDEFHDYICRRWNEGCRNATQFFRELQRKGFTGRCTIVRQYVAELRVIAGVPARSRRPVGQSFPTDPVRKWPSARTLAWLATQPSDWLDADDQFMVGLLPQANPIVKTMVQMAQSFAAMVRQRQPQRLEAWLTDATAPGIKALRSFASGVRADYQAVYAAIGLPWSNGRTEGFVNRLKCIKRQAYGRAKLDLLRQRLVAG